MLSKIKWAAWLFRCFDTCLTQIFGVSSTLLHPCNDRGYTLKTVFPLHFSGHWLVRGWVPLAINDLLPYWPVKHWIGPCYGQECVLPRPLLGGWLLFWGSRMENLVVWDGGVLSYRVAVFFFGRGGGSSSLNLKMMNSNIKKKSLKCKRLLWEP